ncbi:MAG: cytochrome c maturation protein CcmE [Chloroflexi bacterium]|nr:cytochrome c maturation protein CcmE [Chloroflexota bacterium]
MATLEVTCAPSEVARAGRRFPLKIASAGGVLLLAMAYLVLTATSSSTVYYLTVPELRAQGMAPGKLVRVSGDVAEGSIVRDGTRVRFAIADSSGDLPVAYAGVVPDIFGENVQVVVEGRPDAEGTFQATTLLAKCPSRFDSAPDAGPQA